MAKIQEEVDELREVVDTGPAADPARAEEEMGDLLFAIANLARKLGIEPETALRKANDKFTRRFASMERIVADSGRTMRDMSLEELEREWQRVKSGSNKLTSGDCQLHATKTRKHEARRHSELNLNYTPRKHENTKTNFKERSLQTVLQHGYIEVHQETNLQPRHAQIAQELCVVHGNQSLD